MLVSEEEKKKELLDRVEDLLSGPYGIMDPFPMQVPKNAGGQYFAVEHYFMQTPQRTVQYSKFAEIFLRLNCYYDMTVTFDGGETWETNPDPETFVSRTEQLPQNGRLRVLFEEKNVMMDLEGDSTFVTVYDPKGQMTGLLQCFALAHGLFLWGPPKMEEDE